VLYGGAGNDTLLGCAGNDVAFGEENDDVIWGHDGDDTLNGGGGMDLIYAGWGNDTIVGGAGADLMVGESGMDFFKYANLTESTSEAMDIIHDFEQGQDCIDLSALGFVETDFGTAIIYDIINGNTIVRDIPSGLAFQLNGEHQLAASDFAFA